MPLTFWANSFVWLILSHSKFALGRVEAPPSDGPADLESIRPGTGRSVCLMESPHCQLWYGLTEAPLAHAPIIDSSLAHSSEEGPPITGEGHNLAPMPRSLEPPSIIPSKIFHPQWKDPQRCGIESVLFFLQGGLDRHLSASTLKVQVAALSANHDLAALTSVKRVGDLQALSVNNSCLDFGPANSHIVLRPRPRYVPKVPTTPFRDQVVTLQTILSQEGNPNLSLTAEGEAKDLYQARGLPCLLGVRAHLTRGVTASAALANGAFLTHICRAEGWATPNTFARFYNLQMESVPSRVLNASSSTQETGAV
ncbi:N(4)-bis(aminopropyl)spermidine synthase [Labeo rohita]|uniref:N(4)-bis(Aminopropyl)spermidine synthase n=1 Tax=Labeo rohita TaxID=84645 RepID=A0ABQ8L120_LABRO|nr:N(4)-bis(aminopropyl)spermidine synthase [Labeo rohita]